MLKSAKSKRKRMEKELVVMSQSEELQPLFKETAFSDMAANSFDYDHELLHCEVYIPEYYIWNV